MFPKLEGQFALVVQAIMFTKSGGSVSFPGSDYVSAISGNAVLIDAACLVRFLRRNDCECKYQTDNGISICHIYNKNNSL